MATIGTGTTMHQGGDYAAALLAPVAVYFSGKGGGVAYKEKKEGAVRVVYNGRPQQAYQKIEEIVLSPDGRRIAYVASMGEKWFVVVDGREGAKFDSVGTPKFSPDGRHVVYNAKKSGRYHFIVDERMVAANEKFPTRWDEFFSGDSSRVVLITNSAEDGLLHRVVVSDLPLRELRSNEIRAHMFTYNRDLNRIAAIAESAGKKRVVAFSIDRPDLVTEGPDFDDIVDHQFAPDGASLLYLGVRGKDRYLVLKDRLALLPEVLGTGEFVARPDMKAASILLREREGFYLYTAFLPHAGKQKKYEDAGSLLYSPDGRRIVHTARKGKQVFLIVNGKAGPAYDMVVTPLFSPDGRFLVYRARKDGKRFVVVADADGRPIKTHRAYEQVFPVVFTDDGKSVAYGVKDGQDLVWVVEKL